jgi:hypothetical protein
MLQDHGLRSQLPHDAFRVVVDLTERGDAEDGDIDRLGECDRGGGRKSAWGIAGGVLVIQAQSGAAVGAQEVAEERQRLQGTAARMCAIVSLP